MQNVVTVIFDVESEAYQAFREICDAPKGKDYVVAELALVKHEGDVIRVVDDFDATSTSAGDTATGAIVGTLIGIIGGPIGMLIGGATGALAGSLADDTDSALTDSGLEICANKLYENETAIIALVQEEEPAFDAAFVKYETTIIRQDVAQISDEIERVAELDAQLAREARARLRAEKEAKKKAEREGRREKRQAKIDAKFAELDAKFADLEAKKAEDKAKLEQFDEAADIAHDEFVAETKKMEGLK